MILHGDSLERLKEFPENYFDCVVTSPPYDSLRKYEGLSFEKFQLIAAELKRVLRHGGVIVWVVNDATVRGSETGTSFRQALFFKEIGLNIHDTMIYSATKPPLTHNRYEQKFEYMFILSKGKPKTFNPIMEPCKYAGQSKGMTFRHDGNELGKAHTPGPVRAHKIKGNIWHYNVGKHHSTLWEEAFKHPAIFPEKLAEDHILSWTNPGDLVLDPFCGSGTTLVMAKKLGRNFVGIELNQEYVEIATRRLEAG